MYNSGKMNNHILSGKTFVFTIATLFFLLDTSFLQAAEVKGKLLLTIPPILAAQASPIAPSPLPIPVPANVYEVGPGRAHENLSSIDWPELQAGDEVRIYWREKPYRSKIGLRSRGTALQPIKIIGIAGPNGERPVISGIDATTPASLNGFFETDWTEFLGVIVIHAGPDDEWGYKPGHIIIEGLKLEGAHKNYQYQAMDGQQRYYAAAAAGIWAVVVEHLTVRDCELTNNGNGFFVLSKDSEEVVSRDVLFEKNYVHGNGVVGSDQEHNSYTQVAGIIFQQNHYGPLREGAQGIALKDRSSNTVIRYNWIESGVRSLDLVEPEDSYQVLLQEPGFRDTWVYGNIILNEYSPNHAWAVNMIHYGGDMGNPEYYRKGTLHFFHNTVYIKMNRADDPDSYGFNIFDLSTNDEKVILHNNIFYHQGTWSGDDPMFSLARHAGIYVFEARNWMNSGWVQWGPDGGQTATGTVIQHVPPLTGSNPGFTDPDEHDFSVLPSAVVHDQAVTLPSIINSTHPLNTQYVLHLQSENRQMEGNAMELGAFEVGGGTPQ